MTATRTRHTYPTIGATYWAALASVGDTGWTTVWGSYHGAQVDPEGAVGYGAALFTTRDGAERYLAAHGPTMAPGAEHLAPVVAPVVYVGGTYYRTAPAA
jgi:hypothetical protein